MKRFSAQYIITNAGPVLRKGVVAAGDDGTIVSVEDTSGSLTEKAGTEFHNGIIIPGFVNCHCHLELSGLKGKIAPGTGLAEFVRNIREKRDDSPELKTGAMSTADEELYLGGTVLCADICNSEITFKTKKDSRVNYINLLEIFGVDPGRAGKRLDEIIQLSEKAEKEGLEHYVVPHSAYSLSLSLFRRLKEISGSNRVTSIHFMESAEEMTFLSGLSGSIRRSYEESGLGVNGFETVRDHITAILDEVTPSGNLILVHNTFTDRKTIRRVMARKNLFWCLCPASNLYIENMFPPAGLLAGEGCEIVLGTDSLASNNRLSLLEELKILQERLPLVPLTELIRWATINGARALCKEALFGSIVSGKKPGLLLLENADLINMKLTSETRVKRIL